MVRLTRRRFLELASATGAAASFPWVSGCSDADLSQSAARFFTDDERRVVRAMAGAIVPEDDLSVGAVVTDAVEFIDRWLAAFENDPPGIYRSGPFSGRTPFPDPATGLPGREYPANDFLEVLPLTRMQDLAFRIELYGSGAVPGGDINAPLVPSTPGRRADYRATVAAWRDAASSLGVDSFEAVDDEQKLGVFAETDPGFRSAFLHDVAQGMFSAPEYGGNRDGLGWRDYDYDGDSQPLGYTLFGPDGEPFDHPDRPNQTADPARPARAFSPEVESFIEAITIGQGGRRFF
ncbi:MAG: gluconate 2-dehydrogenase subunit 3 family protein [Candidatus Binatia bacterium]|nr:gluconate 2-dehydrogenase subunit 3 family protein [Candidatus Binatia bacterium]